MKLARAITCVATMHRDCLTAAVLVAVLLSAPAAGCAQRSVPPAVAVASSDSAVRYLFAAIDARWNARDAAGMAALHTLDTDILIRGLPRLRGRAAVGETFGRSFAGAPTTLRHRTVVDEMSPLGSGVVMAEGRILLEDARPDTTVVRGRMTFTAIATETPGGWQVRVLRAAPEPAPPPPATPTPIPATPPTQQR